MNTVKIGKEYNSAMDSLWAFLTGVNHEAVETINSINANITENNIGGANTCSTKHLNDIFDEYHDLKDAVVDSKFESSEEFVEWKYEDLMNRVKEFRKIIKIAERNITSADFIVPKMYDIPGNIHNGSVINGGKDTIVVQLYNDQAYIRRLTNLVKEGVEFLLSELYDI